MRALVAASTDPEVLFSPIASAPKAIDVAPTKTIVWTSGRDLEGVTVPLPRWSTVISRANPGGRAPRHYALVCHSDEPLRIDSSPPFLSMSCLQNLVTSSKIGASQVTAVVRYAPARQPHGTLYPVAMRVRLVPPYFVSLADPQPTQSSLASAAAPMN
jgi:hypothetical protein